MRGVIARFDSVAADKDTVVSRLLQDYMPPDYRLIRRYFRFRHAMLLFDAFMPYADTLRCYAFAAMIAGAKMPRRAPPCLLRCYVAFRQLRQGAMLLIAPFVFRRHAPA